MAIHRFRLVSGCDNVIGVPEANSQSFLAGDLVFLSSGQVKICTGTAQGAAGVYGVAQKAGANDTANAYTPVLMVTPEQLWKTFVATGSTVAAAVSPGVDYKLAQSSAGAGVIGAAGADCVVMSYDRRDGTVTGGTAIIRFDHDACQGVIGA